MPNEIFDDIKSLYRKENFAEEVKSYFTSKFFTTKNGEVQLDESEEAQFDTILDKAITRLQKEEREAEQLKVSKVKRAARAVGRFMMDLSTLGLWRLFKTKTAEVQFNSLVKHATMMANKAVRPRESEAEKGAYDLLEDQLKLALREKIKPHGRLERNEDIRDKLIAGIAKTCMDGIKKNPMLDPQRPFQ
jgi:hypothetical protein